MLYLCDAAMWKANFFSAYECECIKRREEILSIIIFIWRENGGERGGDWRARSLKRE